jgi:hypothetical protein
MQCAMRKARKIAYDNGLYGIAMTEPADTLDDANLPAIIPPVRPGALTPLPDTHLVQALIAAACEQAG